MTTTAATMIPGGEGALTVIDTGSPPAFTAPGWHPHPDYPSIERFWDGWRWTGEHRFAGTPAESASPSTPSAIDANAMARWDNTIQGDNYGAINQAGRDVNIRTWNEHRHGDADASDSFAELFGGRGVGRVLIAVGIIVSIVGMVLLVSAFLTVVQSSHPGLTPGVVNGFILAAAGGLLTSLGVGMSRAARAREWRHATDDR
jgi:hypothetical protein